MPLEWISLKYSAIVLDSLYSIGSVVSHISSSSELFSALIAVSISLVPLYSQNRISTIFM